MKPANKLILHFLSNIIALVIGISLAVWFVSYWRTDKSITQLVEILDTPVIRAGDDIVFHRSIVRDKICKTDVDNFIIYVENGADVVVWRDRSIGGFSPLGSSLAKVVVPTPKTLTPNHYILRTIVHPECGLSNMANDLHFDVVE